MMPRRLLGAVVAVMLFVPSAVAAQDAASEPLPEVGTLLDPGRYTSSTVGPSIDFRVDEGWLVGPSGGPILTLLRADTPGTVLTITRFDGDVFLDSCDPSSMVVVDSSVPRLAEVIGGNPYLNAGPPGAIEVDGHSGLWLDVGVPAYIECHRPSVLIWAVPIGAGGEFVQEANQQSRFILLDVDGDVIVIAIETYPGVPFGGLLEASLELVESMRIEPGEYVPPEPTPSPDATAEPTPSAEPTTDAEASPSPLVPAADGTSA